MKLFELENEKLVFTTDSYTVDPIFFPGGDIGKISICGTVNDLAVMGADPLGISLSLIIEEGFLKKDLATILQSINEISNKNKVMIEIDETMVPVKKEVRSVCDLLGLDIYNLACEGRFVSIVSDKNSEQVLKLLKEFDSTAALVGKVLDGEGVVRGYPQLEPKCYSVDQSTNQTVLQG